MVLSLTPFTLPTTRQMLEWIFFILQWKFVVYNLLNLIVGIRTVQVIGSCHQDHAYQLKIHLKILILTPSLLYSGQIQLGLSCNIHSWWQSHLWFNHHRLRCTDWWDAENSHSHGQHYCALCQGQWWHVHKKSQWHLSVLQPLHHSVCQKWNEPVLWYSTTRPCSGNNNNCGIWRFWHSNFYIVQIRRTNVDLSWDWEIHEKCKARFGHYKIKNQLHN